MRTGFWFLLVAGIFPAGVRGGPADSLRIQKYRDHISLAGHLTRIGLSNNLSVSGRPERVVYRTSNAVRLGISFDYRWLGVEIFGRLPVVESDKRGITRNRGVFLRVNRSRFWANGIYQIFSGFYWHNAPEIVRSGVAAGAYPLRPDMKSRLLFLNGFYVFRPGRFSNPAAQGENERQRKSGGSLLAGPGLYYHSLEGSGALLPDVYFPVLTGLQGIRSIRSVILSLNLGYAHTLVLKEHFYLSLYGMPGLSRTQADTRMLDGSHNRIPGRWTLRLETRASAGYNSDHFFAGVMYASFFNNQPLKADAGFAYGFHTLRFFAGKRFGVKKPLGFLRL